MQRPDRLWQQYEGKARAELLRGSGRWPLQPHPCALEPPHETFNRRALTRWDCWVNGWHKPWEPSWLKRLFDLSPPVLSPGEETLGLPEVAPSEDLVAIVVAQFPEDETTIPRAEQLLLSLPATRYPVAFELYGLGQIEDRPPLTVVQFVADRSDAELLRSQLFAHYPNSAVVDQPIAPVDDFDPQHIESWVDDDSAAAQLALQAGHCFSLRTFTKLDPDPLGVAIAAMDQLGEEQWAMLQVLFQAVRGPWAETLMEAVADPYHPGKYLFEDLSDRLLQSKLGSPLFAVAVHVLASTDAVYRQLLGWAEQFSNPPQKLLPNTDLWPGEMIPEGERELLADAVRRRCTYRSGMLLNLEELASLAHLPGQSVISQRLRRVPTRTRPAAPFIREKGSVILGENTHRGRTEPAGIPAEVRSRHTYICGASGTGKSTLLLNMLLQDIAAGSGVGVLDPHGDLIHEILPRIPANRLSDVVYFNSPDTRFPVGLNVLAARDEAERERIVSEIVTALHRFFPDAWGPRLQHILTHALATAVQIPDATLRDVRRILTEDAFRFEVVSRLRDPDLLSFWNDEFPDLPKGSLDPILNKLSPFLLNRTVRNIICQRRSRIDFDEILNRRKIFLANLSGGLLTTQVAGVLGSFVVTKIIHAAFRRARLPRAEREPWCLFVDEFQNFVELASATQFEQILSEARKYGLVLHLANQYVAQIPPSIRAAIFGNVGTLVSFRLGSDDAKLLAYEFGAFTASEIMSLERGEALARVGGSATAFNLTTFPEPERPPVDQTAAIIEESRKRYAQPREHVEASLSPVGPEKQSVNAPGSDAATARAVAQAAVRAQGETDDFVE